MTRALLDINRLSFHLCFLIIFAIAEGMRPVECAHQGQPASSLRAVFLKSKHNFGASDA